MQLDRFSTFEYIEFTKLLERNIEIPIFQRSYCEERVQYFLDSLIEFLSEYNEVMCLNCLHFAKIEDQYVLIDGQHRFRAYRQLVQEYDLENESNFRIPIVIRNCHDISEAKAYFTLLNNHFITDSLPTNIDELQTTEKIKAHILLKYPKFVSHAERPRFPNINLDSFVQFLLERFPRDTIAKFEKFQDLLEIPNLERQQILSKGTLMITYVYHQNQKNVRQTIPASLRRNVWHSVYHDELNGNCFVCGIQITFHNFHVGHIIPVCKGGTNHLDNLRCVCNLCNLSMGSQNMYDFKQNYYPS